ncbi:9899_t:CDS:2, partial [Acaulospora colombiana]
MVYSLRLPLFSKAPSPPLINTLLLHVLSLLLLTNLVSAEPVALSLQPSNRWDTLDDGSHRSSSPAAYATWNINTNGQSGPSTLSLNIMGYNRRGNTYTFAPFIIKMDGQTLPYLSEPNYPITIPLQNNHGYSFEADPLGAEGLIISMVDYVPAGTTNPTTTSSQSSTTTNPATETTDSLSTISTASQQTSRTTTVGYEQATDKTDRLSTDTTSSRLSLTSLSVTPSGLVSPPPYTGTFGDTNSTLTSAAAEGSNGPSKSK